MQTLENSRVLITGAGGFLGSHIIPGLLSAGAEVAGVDLKSALDNGNLKQVKSKIELTEVDITNSSHVEQLDIKCDYLVHLAAIAAPALCEKNPEKAFLTNVQGTFNLLKYAVRKSVKRVIFSCYDENTLAFTLEGLKHYSELQIGDRVLSLNSGGIVEVDRITAIHTYPYDGQMFHFKGKDTVRWELCGFHLRSSRILDGEAR